MNAMLSDKTVAKVTQILADELNIQPELVIPEARIMADLSADSLDVVNITMRIEEDLDIIIEDRATDRIETVGDLYEVIGEYFQKTGRPD